MMNDNHYPAIIFVVCALMLLAFCSIQPPEVEPRSITERFIYLKDRYGLCYAAVTSDAYDLHRAVSIATVPCDRVDL